MRCPWCGSPVMIRGSSWECGWCGDSGRLKRTPVIRTGLKMRTKLGMNGRMIERSSLADSYIGVSNVGLSYVGKSNAIK